MATTRNNIDKEAMKHFVNTGRIAKFEWMFDEAAPEPVGLERFI
jgi:hypothetical protein